MLPSIFKKGFMDDFFNDDFLMDFGGKNRNVMMKSDIKELENSYLLEVEATHNENKDEKDKEGKYIRKERYSGHCTRSFYVGENLKEEDIKGKFENGILKLEVPKKAAEEKVEEKKYIQIEG